MCMLVACVLAGGYCSWKFVGGWSGFSLHPLLGVSTMAGMLTQVMIAMCRCSPDHGMRFIFNWIHFTLGNATHILAICTILTAYEATPLPILFLYLMAAFILFHIVIHLIMQMKREPTSDGMYDCAALLFFAGNTCTVCACESVWMRVIAEWKLERALGGQPCCQTLARYAS